MTEISQPAVLVEDTHPNPIVLPSTIRRVLLVRPPTFEYLSLLNGRYSSVYSAFLLCDSPNSPTWPYSEAETESLVGWSKWHVIGPIYRAEGKSDIQEVRERYAVRSGQRICVFSMGGGGQHRPTDLDVERFLAIAESVAENLKRIDQEARLIFVRGPYFPSDVKIDRRFEIVPQEARMPALLAMADGAVIRTGFNTTWECLAAGTPFMPFIGTTFAEPTHERLTRLRACGLLADDVNTFWNDNRWREQFRQTCRHIFERWPGKPEGARLKQLLLDLPQDRPKRSASHRSEGEDPIAAHARISRPAAHFRFGRKIPLIIRIDDVVAPDPALSWLLRMLSSRRLRASLEVVPYLADFDERWLDALDPAGDLFEVSQHGYAHIPRSGADGKRHEFAPDSSDPTLDDDKGISWGKKRLEQAFPTRFSGGFSPPFDGFPTWLPSLWSEKGGKFISSVFIRRLEGAPIPVIRAGIDVWNWSRNEARGHRDVLRAIERQTKEDGHAGIILHPHRLRRRLELAHLVWLLDLLQRRGFRPASLRELAAAGGAPAPTRLSTLKRRLNIFAAWASRRS